MRSMGGLPMSVTIDLKMLLLIIVCIAVVVLVIYLIRLLRSLMVTLGHADEVLKDVEVITDIAAKRSEDVDGIITDLAGTVSGLTEDINEKQNMISTVTAIVKAVISAKKAADKAKADK
jgi:uncharacterized protein YoxC